MYKLGAQGRAAQKLLSQRPYVSQSAHPTGQRLPSQDEEQRQVELLLTLLSANDINQTGQQLLSYVVHYFPRLKNEEDIQLLTAALLGNSAVFNPFDFEGCYNVIEAVKAMFEQKIRISEPSLPLTKFFHGVSLAVYNHSSGDWKKSLVLTGIILSKPLYEQHRVPETRGYFEQLYDRCIQLNHELIVRSFRNVAVNNYEVNSLVSISLACSLISFSDTQKHNLPHEQVLIHVIDLVFNSPYGVSELQNIPKLTHKPVMKHLSRLSFLVENCFVNGVKYPVLDGALTAMLDYAFTLHSEVNMDDQQTWEILKTVLFGVVIMLQGFASFSLNLYNGLKQDEHSTLATKVTKILFFLNFIIERMGSGGFQAYNFVFLTTIDGLFQHSTRTAEQIGSFMVSHCALQQIPQSFHESSKALFALNYFEQFTKTCTHQYQDAVIAPFVNHFVEHPQLLPPSSPPELTRTHRSIIEASHSVILATFTPRNAAIIAATAPGYLRTVLSQFPVLLSSRQLSIAVESITKAVAPPSEAYYLNKDNLREVLHTLYISIINSPCSQPLNEEGLGGPQTVRQALISSLIKTLTYVPVEMLENWLNNVWELSCGDAYLEQELWKEISEGMDMQRGTIGVQWWYNRGALTTKL